MIPILRSKFSRPAGAPMFGKRTECVKTSVSALTKQLCQEEAKAAGFANVGDWVHAVIVHEVARKHVAIVNVNAPSVYRINSANSRERGDE